MDAFGEVQPAQLLAIAASALAQYSEVRCGFPTSASHITLLEPDAVPGIDFQVSMTAWQHSRTAHVTVLVLAKTKHVQYLHYVAHTVFSADVAAACRFAAQTASHPAAGMRLVVPGRLASLTGRTNHES